MVQCTSASAPQQYSNGLTCQSTTSTSAQGFGVVKGTDCRFKCPDGRLLSLPEAVVSESKQQLNFEFCGVPLPTATPATKAGAAAPAPLVSPLNQTIEGCDMVAHVLNFAFVQPTPNLTGKQLTVDIQGQPMQCSIPSGMPGTYSCKLPPNVSFPAGIVVKINGQMVDEFPYGGIGCIYAYVTPTRIRPTVAPYSSPYPTLPPTLPPTPVPTRQPTQPPPTPQPTSQPTQPAPTQPAPTQPPPTTAPTDPPATQPAPTSAPATQPAPTSAAPPTPPA